MRRLRKRLYIDPNVGELARDVDDALDALGPVRKVIKFVEKYTEPMRVLFPRNPEWVEVKRLQRDSAPEEAIPCYAVVSFHYELGKGGQGQIVINEVDGPVLNEVYRWTLEVVG